MYVIIKPPEDQIQTLKSNQKTSYNQSLKEYILLTTSNEPGDIHLEFLHVLPANMSFRDEGMVWLGSGMSIKAPCIKAWSWVWETAQELRVLVLPVDLTPIPSTEVRWITTTCNSSFQGSNTLFILWRVPACVWLSLTHTHTHKKNLTRSSLVLTSALWRDGRKLEEVGLGGMVYVVSVMHEVIMRLLFCFLLCHSHTTSSYAWPCTLPAIISYFATSPEATEPTDNGPKPTNPSTKTNLSSSWVD